MLFANPDIPVDQSMQYGAFGLVCLLIIWFMAKGAPMLMSKHEAILDNTIRGYEATIGKVVSQFEATINKLVAEFHEDATRCREERMATAKEAAAEREKDRALRAEFVSRMDEVYGRKS